MLPLTGLKHGYMSTADGEGGSLKPTKMIVGVGDGGSTGRGFISAVPAKNNKSTFKALLQGLHLPRVFVLFFENARVDHRIALNFWSLYYETAITPLQASLKDRNARQ